MVEGYCVGLDLATSELGDYSALAIVERELQRRNDPEKGYREYDEPFYNLTWLERFERGTEYPHIIERVKVIFEDPRLKNTGELIVDATGVGVAVMQFLRTQGDLNPIGVTITGGIETQEAKDGFHVPKSHIVSSLIFAFQSAKFKIAQGLVLKTRLIEELQSFSYKIDRKTGHTSYESISEAVHDDLVIACALPLWYFMKDDFREYVGTLSKVNKSEDWDPLEV